MKKQLRFVWLAVLVLLLVAVTAIAASAATPFSTGGESYATLNEAASAVSAGGVITVSEDVTVTSTATLSRAVSYTLKGSTGTETITFTGGGIEIIAGTVTLENVTVVAKAANAITVSNNATKLVVKSGATVKSECSTDTPIFSAFTI